MFLILRHIHPEVSLRLEWSAILILWVDGSLDSLLGGVRQSVLGQPHRPNLTISHNPDILECASDPQRPLLECCGAPWASRFPRQDWFLLEDIHWRMIFLSIITLAIKIISFISPSGSAAPSPCKSGSGCSAKSCAYPSPRYPLLSSCFSWPCSPSPIGFHPPIGCSSSALPPTTASCPTEP